MIQNITTALAVLGAVLGVMNAWRNWVHDRANVKVLFMPAEASDGRVGMSITVRNLSRFAVTINSVSLCWSNLSHTPIDLLRGSFVDPSSLPVRLESRTSLTAFVPIFTTDPHEKNRITHVKAFTACGLSFCSRKL